MKSRLLTKRRIKNMFYQSIRHMGGATLIDFDHSTEVDLGHSR